MKQLAILLFFLFSIFSINAQEGNYKVLTIDLDKKVTHLEKIVEKGKYMIEVVKETDDVNLEISINNEIKEFSSLSYQIKENSAVATAKSGKISSINISLGKIHIKSNSIYTINIKMKKEGSGKVEERVYVFKCESAWDWSTTFGFNSIFLIKNDTYKSIISGESYQIVKGGSQKIIDYTPSIMFTFMDRSNNISWGPSGGLGFDLENISVFAGMSLGIGQNIIITGGVAFHNQKRLDSKYEPNQIIESNITFDDLHSEYYRFNPFVSISFRLDKNPFSK